MSWENRPDKQPEAFPKLGAEDAKSKSALRFVQEMRGSLEEVKPPGDTWRMMPKIQRAPPQLLKALPEFAKYYSPTLVSIGPIHHGDGRLKRGEELKLALTKQYIEKKKIAIDDLCIRILEGIPDLRTLDADDVIKDDLDDHALAKMFLVDGCAVLHFLSCMVGIEIRLTGLSPDEAFLMLQDLMLLENQLPYDVLSLLIIDDNGEQLNTLFYSALKFVQFLNPPSLDELFSPGYSIIKVEELARLETPAHLLDALCKAILYSETDPTLNFDPRALKRTTYRNIEELKATEIRLKSDNITLKNISFTPYFFGGELRLPALSVNEATEKYMMNLIALEQCPDFEYVLEFSAYMRFLIRLIGNPEDVKELRSAGVIVDGSDQEVAQFFKTISSVLFGYNLRIYANVRNQIEAHYSSRLNTWIAQGYYTYFSNPWSFLALLGALLALVLSIIQTWYTIHPKVKGAIGKKNPLKHLSIESMACCVRG